MQAALGCGAPAPPRPNVVLLVVDTLLTDHTSSAEMQAELRELGYVK